MELDFFYDKSIFNELTSKKIGGFAPGFVLVVNKNEVLYFPFLEDLQNFIKIYHLKDGEYEIYKL